MLCRRQSVAKTQCSARVELSVHPFAKGWRGARGAIHNYWHALENAVPPTKPSKHTKRSRVKARGQASRQQACGEREGQSLSHRGSRQKATNKTSWANKVEDGKRSKPSTKARQKAAKRHRFSGKQRREQAPALHVWSGQFAKKRAYSFPANTAPRVRATNCPRDISRTA